MISIDLTHENYKDAFADAKVGDEKTITFKVVKKSATELVGELESYESDDNADDEADAGEDSSAAEPAAPYPSSQSKAPRGVVIAIGKMK